MFLCLGLNKNVFLCMIRNEYSYTMELKALIAECTAYDFKVMLEEKKPKSWLKSVSAFANGLGGSLFFGIDNDGGVKGLDDVRMYARPSAVRFVTIWIPCQRWR